jgi:hypothetical protein
VTNSNRPVDSGGSDKQVHRTPQSTASNGKHQKQPEDVASFGLCA